jgi:hypothetical protein
MVMTAVVSRMPVNFERWPPLATYLGNIKDRRLINQISSYKYCGSKNQAGTVSY